MLNKTSAAALEAGPVQPLFTGEGELQKGVTALLCTNLIWGMLPIYWKQIAHVPAMEIVCHRSLWGFFLCLGLLWLRGGLGEIKDVVRDKRTMVFMAGCSLSHMFGWTFFIWAVSSGHILDAALGNYLLPILSVLCGFFLFRERPRRIQWLAIGLAAFGVAGMVIWYGSLPWVGLVIATNAVIFAVLRKFAPVNAMPGLIVDLLMSAPLLWGYLLYLVVSGKSVFLSVGYSQDLWLVGAGIMTIIPQMGQAYGLCRVPLTTISLMQYIPPTGNFLVGLFLFGEVFSQDKIFGAIFIWSALIIYTVDSIIFQQKTRRTLGIKDKLAAE